MSVVLPPQNDFSRPLWRYGYDWAVKTGLIYCTWFASQDFKQMVAHDSGIFLLQWTHQQHVGFRELEL